MIVLIACVEMYVDKIVALWFVLPPFILVVIGPLYQRIRYKQYDVKKRWLALKICGMSSQRNFVFFFDRPDRSLVGSVDSKKIFLDCKKTQKPYIFSKQDVRPTPNFIHTKCIPDCIPRWIQYLCCSSQWCCQIHWKAYRYSFRWHCHHFFYEPTEYSVP